MIYHRLATGAKLWTPDSWRIRSLSSNRSSSPLWKSHKDWYSQNLSCWARKVCEPQDRHRWGSADVGPDSEVGVQHAGFRLRRVHQQGIALLNHQGAQQDGWWLFYRQTANGLSGAPPRYLNFRLLQPQTLLTDLVEQLTWPAPWLWVLWVNGLVLESRDCRFRRCLLQLQFELLAINQGLQRAGSEMGARELQPSELGRKRRKLLAELFCKLWQSHIRQPLARNSQTATVHEALWPSGDSQRLARIRGGPVRH